MLLLLLCVESQNEINVEIRFSFSFFYLFGIHCVRLLASGQRTMKKSVLFLTLSWIERLSTPSCVLRSFQIYKWRIFHALFVCIKFFFFVLLTLILFIFVLNIYINLRDRCFNAFIFRYGGKVFLSNTIIYYFLRCKRISAIFSLFSIFSCWLMSSFSRAVV